MNRFVFWFFLAILLFGPVCRGDTATVLAAFETGGLELEVMKLAGDGLEYSLTGLYAKPHSIPAKEFRIEHFELKDPLRYVIDIPTKEPAVKNVLTLDSGTLHQIRIGKRPEGLRVVLEFEGSGNLLASLEREEDRGIFRFHLAHLGRSETDGDPTIWEEVLPEDYGTEGVEY